jgi:hypothetical protein
MRIGYYCIAVGLAASLAVAVGCGGSSQPVNSLAPFQPEIVNTADDFQFQATDVDSVTATVGYDWSNSGAQATIDHSSAVTGGLVSVVVYDAVDSLVYSSPLVASANEPSSSGVPGLWRIEVTLNNCSGTLNFRAQKL